MSETERALTSGPVTGKKIVAMVPARGGSAGLPNKNIRELGGVPLIGHSIRPALACPDVSATYINSDTSIYLEIGDKLGAVPYARPLVLGEATTTMQAVVADFVYALSKRGVPMDAVLVLYPTYPFRTAKQLSDLIAFYLAQDDCDSVVGLKQPDTHPYLCANRDEAGGVSTFVPYDINRYYRRQDYPECYELTAWALIASADKIDDLNAQMMSPRTRGYVVPEDARIVDVDTLADFQFAEFLLDRGYV